MEDSSNSPLNDIFFISNSLNQNQLEDVLSAEFIIKDYNPSAIKEYLQLLSTVDNLIIFVGDNQYAYNDD